jgi:hypothetical protein
MVYHSLRIVFTHYAPSSSLHAQRSKPRLVYILGRHLSQLREVAPNIVAILICLLTKRYRRIHTKVLIEEARATQPLPVGVIECIIRIQQQQLEDLRSLLPMLP